MSRGKKDYTAFDHPSILQFLFNPRPEWGVPAAPETFQEILIPVEDNVVVGSRFYSIEKSGPVILFFHGNGEIVEDYGDLAQLYRQRHINFFPVDYRGYGKSTGMPSVSTMMNDCHVIFETISALLKNEGYTGPLIVMGRSLGSAAALELADSYRDRIDGLIVESGFAFALPLLQLIGIDIKRIGIREEQGFSNFSKIAGFDKPTLIIHAELDHIIPFSEGEYLFNNSPAKAKNLLMIPRANHNNIFAIGLDAYLQSIQNLIQMILQR
ncbi:alpha/beta hydrolase [bacterium]|nr:alpha/beta hydrolase [bacterium]